MGHIKKIFFSIVCILGILPLTLAAKTNNLPIKEKPLIYNEQDRPSFSLCNPLKGLFNFIVFTRFPAPNKRYADKISSLVTKELGLFGEIRKPKMLVDSEEGEAIDLSGFDEGVFLIYEIKNLTSVDGKNLGIVRASLNLSTSVFIKKTLDECESYIWSCICFLKGSVEKDLENLLAQSINYLLKNFTLNYLTVNKQKPIFNLYTQ